MSRPRLARSIRARSTTYHCESPSRSVGVPVQGAWIRWLRRRGQWRYKNSASIPITASRPSGIEQSSHRPQEAREYIARISCDLTPALRDYMEDDQGLCAASNGYVAHRRSTAATQVRKNHFDYINRGRTRACGRILRARRDQTRRAAGRRRRHHQGAAMNSA